MTANIDEEKVLRALYIKFQEHTLPHALSIKEEIDKGGLLSDWDIGFLEEAIDQASHAKALVDRHSDLQVLYAKTIRLYDEITAQALKNEEQADPGAGER